MQRDNRKSCHSDQLHTSSVDLAQLFGTAIVLGGDRVHKRVHKRALRMATLTQDSKGNYRARKRLPNDVRDDYGRLYGPRVEAKFFASASTKRHEAKQLFGEWLSEVESRISNIRAQREGEGLVLTRQQARALAGEWYDWFLARHSHSDKDWEQVLGQVQDALCQAVGEKRWNENHPD